MHSIFIIYAKKRHTLNSLYQKIENPPDIPKLSKHLIRISVLQGEVTYSDAVGKYYDEWYREYFSQEVDDETGSALRILESMLKIAMLISLSEDDERVIKKDHVDKAIELVEPLVFAAKRTVLGQGKASLANQTATFLMELLEREGYKCSRKDMLAKHWRDFDSEDCNRIVVTLIENSAITQELVGNIVCYTLTSEAVEQLKGMIK